MPDPVLRVRGRLGGPAAATLRHAARAPRGEVKLYPEGHFAIYVDDAFERVVADQLAFLDKHLRG
ncbi:alpha/beta hydrolase domain protein [Mycobacterium intracellulare 1956]|uniref:Alpha/beta hydrolase domain protein n=1 Tax=Mycobacterium intracellulare 1956 TaxID=1299331 RepID=X8CEI5_MYCIT|nr:alpha/beta hydrolase domain protein [Mycobacterium intracellulare 1956]